MHTCAISPSSTLTGPVSDTVGSAVKTLYYITVVIKFVMNASKYMYYNFYCVLCVCTNSYWRISYFVSQKPTTIDKIIIYKRLQYTVKNRVFWQRLLGRPLDLSSLAPYYLV